MSGGKTVSRTDWNKALSDLYAKKDSIGVVFPGFRDIYKQAGVSESYGRIDDQNGVTFSETLDLALESDSELIQIATWNDFGEGTVIEPTTNLGYRYVDTLQDRLSPGFSPEDLRLPATLYQLRKKLADHAEIQKASGFLLAGEPDKARPIIEKLSGEEGSRAFAKNSKYRLVSDILYREGEGLTDYEKTRCRLDVYYPSGPKPYATVIWFHGGGIQKGNKEIPVPLRNKGVAVVSANYRLNPNVKSPDYIEDAAAAVAWTIKNIHRFGAGRPEGVFVSGHSAGGYLASMVGMDKKYLAAHDINTKQLAGLIPFSGHTITHFTIRGERGISGNQAIIDELAPIFHVGKEPPPMLLITGDREKELMGRYEENAYFWRMMKVVKHPDTELRELEGYDHGGMPEPAFPLLLEFMEKRFKPSN